MPSGHLSPILDVWGRFQKTMLPSCGDMKNATEGENNEWGKALSPSLSLSLSSLLHLSFSLRLSIPLFISLTLLSSRWKSDSAPLLTSTPSPASWLCTPTFAKSCSYNDHTQGYSVLAALPGNLTAAKTAWWKRCFWRWTLHDLSRWQELRWGLLTVHLFSLRFAAEAAKQ